LLTGIFLDELTQFELARGLPIAMTKSFSESANMRLEWW